jgi:hypothetical protein
METI